MNTYEVVSAEEMQQEVEYTLSTNISEFMLNPRNWMSDFLYVILYYLFTEHTDWSE